MEESEDETKSRFDQEGAPQNGNGCETKEFPSALAGQLRRLLSFLGAGKLALAAMTRRQTTTGESKLERLKSQDSGPKRQPLVIRLLQLRPTRATTVEKRLHGGTQRPATNALGLTPVLHPAIGLDDSTRL